MDRRMFIFTPATGPADVENVFVQARHTGVTQTSQAAAGSNRVTSAKSH